MSFADTSFNFGIVNNSTDGTSWNAGNLTAAADNLVVWCVASDNLTTTDGQTNDHTGVTSDSGETWTKLGEFTNGQGSAAAGATVSLWYTFALGATLTNVTISFSGSITKKAAGGRRFTVTSGSVALDDGPITLADDNADPGSISVGSATNREKLFIRAIASETNSAVALTPTTSWTVYGSAQTSGGGSAANMAQRGEFRILTTGTAQATDPTFAAEDTASLAVALYEVVADTRVPYSTPYPQLLGH